MQLLSPAPDGGRSREQNAAVKGLKPGDVLMCALKMKDKHKEGRFFDWRFFALVTKTLRHGFHVEVLVLDDREREVMTLSLMRPDHVVHLLDPERWPDGVHAFRTKAILDGKVEADVF